MAKNEIKIAVWHDSKTFVPGKKQEKALLAALNEDPQGAQLRDDWLKRGLIEGDWLLDGEVSLGSDDLSSEEAIALFGRLERVSQRFSLVSGVTQELDEHPVDYLERLVTTAEQNKVEDDDEDEIVTNGLPVVSTSHDDLLEEPQGQQETPEGQQEPPSEGLTGEEFAQKLRVALPGADDVVAVILTKDIRTEKALRETPDADLKAIPNLGDARLAKLREAFASA